MRNYFACFVALVAAGTALPSAALAQMPAQPPATAKAKSSAPVSPRDLNGMYQFYNNTPGQGIYATASKAAPPMTPWAQARYDANKPGYGPRITKDENDPILHCTPAGFPRVIMYPQPVEIVQTPERTFMFFERDHAWRQVWTDGRDHPKDIEPTWMGDAIGKWDGDTFVVDTVGFNDKSWVDFYGYPHSDQLHLIERYRRVDANTLTFQYTIEDPKAFTKPWVSDTKIYKKLPKDKAVMEELFCVPEEEEAFTKRIREPAGAGQGTSK